MGLAPSLLSGRHRASTSAIVSSAPVHDSGPISPLYQEAMVVDPKTEITFSPTDETTTRTQPQSEQTPITDAAPTVPETGGGVRDLDMEMEMDYEILDTRAPMVTSHKTEPALSIAQDVATTDTVAGAESNQESTSSPSNDIRSQLPVGDPGRPVLDESAQPGVDDSLQPIEDDPARPLDDDSEQLIHEQLAQTSPLHRPRGSSAQLLLDPVDSSVNDQPPTIDSDSVHKVAPSPVSMPVDNFLQKPKLDDANLLLDNAVAPHPVDNEDHDLIKEPEVFDTIKEQGKDAQPEVQQPDDPNKAPSETAVIEKKKYVLRELAGMAIINSPGCRASSRVIIEWVKRHVPGYSDDAKAWQAEIGALKWAQNISAILAGTTKCFRAELERDAFNHVEYTFTVGGEKDFLHFKRPDMPMDTTDDDHIMLGLSDKGTPKKTISHARRTVASSADPSNAKLKPYLDRAEHSGSSRAQKTKGLRKSSTNFSPSGSWPGVPAFTNRNPLEEQIDTIRVGGGRPQVRSRIADSSSEPGSESEQEISVNRKIAQTTKSKPAERTAKLQDNASGRKNGRTDDGFPDWWHQMNINRKQQKATLSGTHPRWYVDIQERRTREFCNDLDENDFVVKDFFEEWREYHPDQSMKEEEDLAARIKEIHARPSRKQTMHDNIASRKALNRDKETGSIHRLVLPIRSPPVMNGAISRGISMEEMARKERHEAFIREKNNELFPDGWVEVQSTEELHGLPEETIVEISANKGELGHVYIFPVSPLQ